MTLECWAPCYLGVLYLLPVWTQFHNSLLFHQASENTRSNFCFSACRYFFREKMYFLVWYHYCHALYSILECVRKILSICNIYEIALKLELCYTIRTALQVGALHAALEATSFQLLPSTAIPPVVLLVTDCPGLHCGAQGSWSYWVWRGPISPPGLPGCWVPKFLC